MKPIMTEKMDYTMKFKIFYRKNKAKSSQAKRQGIAKIKQGMHLLDTTNNRKIVGSLVFDIFIGTQVAFGANRKKIMRENLGVTGTPSHAIAQLGRMHTSMEWSVVLWEYLDNFGISPKSLGKFARKRRLHKHTVDKHVQSRRIAEKRHPHLDAIRTAFASSVNHGGVKYNIDGVGLRYKDTRCSYNTAHPEEIKANVRVKHPLDPNQKRIYTVTLNLDSREVLLTDNGTINKDYNLATDADADYQKHGEFCCSDTVTQPSDVKDVFCRYLVLCQNRYRDLGIAVN